MPGVDRERWRQAWVSTQPVCCRSAQHFLFTGLGPHAKIPRLESLQAQLGFTSRTAVALLVSISKINPFLDDGCPRAQRADGCPRAQRARAGCQAPAGSRAVRRLCINQILAAHPTAESWGPSTPSTRHLLDGVAVPVPHRVLVEKGLRAPNLRTGPNERSVRTRRNAIFPPSSARASASSRRRASRSGASRWRHSRVAATRRSSRIEGVTALVRSRHASASSFWPTSASTSSTCRVA